MQGRPHIGGCVLKGGLLFGGLIFVLEIAVEMAFPAMGKNRGQIGVRTTYFN